MNTKKNTRFAITSSSLYTARHFDTLTLSSVAGIAVGDFLTGSISGATGFVHDIGGSVVRLKQVSGSFNSNELIKSVAKDIAVIMLLFVSKFLHL